MIQEPPPIEEKPEEAGEVVEEKKPEVVEEPVEEPAPKRRGRPPGAKNKAKPEPKPAPKPSKPRPPREPEPEPEEDSDGDVDAAVGFFAAHLGNLQRRTLEAKRDNWRSLFR